jgi:hypothetical protein
VGDTDFHTAAPAELADGKALGLRALLVVEDYMNPSLVCLVDYMSCCYELHQRVVEDVDKLLVVLVRYMFRLSQNASSQSFGSDLHDGHHRP